MSDCPGAPPATRDEHLWSHDDNLLLEAVALTVEQEGWAERGSRIRRALAELERLQAAEAESDRLRMELARTETLLEDARGFEEQQRERAQTLGTKLAKVRGLCDMPGVSITNIRDALDDDGSE